jgi:hypothetical protein
MKKIRFCLISICLVCFLACTVQKRTFNKGYFVQWNFKQKSKEKVHKTPEISKSEIEDTFFYLSENTEENLTFPYENLDKHQDVVKVESKDKLENKETKASTFKTSKTQLYEKLQEVIEEPKSEKEILEAKQKITFWICIISLPLAIFFMVLSTNSHPFLWAKMLNYLFAFLFYGSLIYYFVLNKKLGKKRVAKAPRIPTEKQYKNKRNWHILFLIVKILFLTWITLTTLISLTIFNIDFYWPFLIIHLFVLHLIVLGIYKVNIYDKLHQIKKDLSKNEIDLISENTIQENFRRGKRIILIVFGVMYIAFIGIMINLMK